MVGVGAREPGVPSLAGKPSMEQPPSSRMSSSSVSSAADSQIRLRISSGGQFLTDARGKVKYVGGTSYLDRVPASFKYSDLAHRFAEKANSSVALKYQVPGESLDEDELVAVSDDLDVQELYEEYGRAEQQQPGKAPRLRIFLFPAMEEDLTLEQYEDGSHFFSEAAEHDWQGEPGQAVPATQPPGGAGGGGRGAGELISSGHSSFSSAQPAAGNGWASPRSRMEQIGPVRTRPSGAWQVAAASGQQTPAAGYGDAWRQGGAGDQGELYCREPAWEEKGDDCGVTTPDAAFEELRLYSSWGRDAQPGDRGDYKEAYADGYNLPTHISAFGDGVLEDIVHLPSYISAFGEDARDNGRLAGLEQAFGQQGVGEDMVLNQNPNDSAHPLVHPGAALEQTTPDERLQRKLSALKPVFRSVPHLSRDAVKVLGCIAEGSFGEVSLAKTQQFGELAIKWLKCGKYERHLEHFWQEADLLARLNHPNVLRLYGVVVASPHDPSVVGIMTEYARGGSLSANLRNFTAPLPLRFRAQLALQIAQGMSYLHACNIVHFDLKPDNLLLDVPLQASLMFEASCHCNLKVADFGLSKEKQRSFVSGVRDLRGTLPFMAPELVNNPDRVDEKADCWSMGMLMWELLTLQSPFQELAPNHIIAGLMRGTLRPAIPGFCEPEWLDLMVPCWALNPTQRPSFAALAQQLEALVDAHS